MLMELPRRLPPVERFVPVSNGGHNNILYRAAARWAVREPPLDSQMT